MLPPVARLPFWTNVTVPPGNGLPLKRTLPETSAVATSFVRPPAGVVAANQVVPLMPAPTKRTLPSPRPQLMPPECGDTARHMQAVTVPPQVQERVFLAQKFVGEGWIRGV